ncbi:MAG TPA: endopeptidase La [Alphaproteobacteria bacterium]|nr:endopeptidase La [Alphaproteobacteria bacterium]
MGSSSVIDLPLLPLRDVVVYPHMVLPLFVGREKSVEALEDAMAGSKQVLLVAQRNAADDNPGVDDIYQVGTVSNILQLLKLPDGTIKVLVEGSYRAVIDNVDDEGRFTVAGVREVESDDVPDDEAEGLLRSTVSQFEKYVNLSKKVPAEVLTSLSGIDEPGRLADTIAAHMSVDLQEKQSILEIADIRARLEHLMGLMEAEIDLFQVEKRIRGRVKKQMEKSQREYYLNEQMKAIQRELGEGEESREEVAELERRINEAKLPKDARTKVDAEFKKLKQMSPMSAEATVVRNYLDWILALPWNKRKRLKSDLQAAETVLDEDHFGLEKVKERILEYLAVQSRSKKLRGPILCLVGPPGVGKTSLGRSIARATGREFVRMSLGGVRDEAEIRGHRRTYIGAMPGRIIQSLKKAKSANPLFLLDEIDKLGADYRGDPSSALLEVLDPEQNARFQDHYLEVDFDLSDIMFVCTANTLDLPQPLLDRMEIIRLEGYTEDEKVEIAQRHLIAKQRKDHVLKADEWTVEEGAIRGLIRYYTREAGVRNLEREIANLARKSVRKIESGEVTSVTVTADNLKDFAGVQKYRFGETDSEDKIGVVTGLAWTEVGGDLLTIEAVKMAGRGKMTVTGNLRDVMKESISAANSFVQARAPSLGVKPTVFRATDIHVHVPEGATPKDGPSAGVGMMTAIVSVLTRNPVRKDVAMTGEITLRGRVLPIGGLKEKLLAALRGGVKTVLIPSENEKDLQEIPDNVKEGLTIIPVSTVEEVLANALANPVEAVEWTEADEAALAALSGPPQAGEAGTSVAH